MLLRLAHPAAAHSMPELGRLIYRTQDDDGEIHVYEDGRFRYLTFGNEVEQSCLDLAQPKRLEHVYTQAMLLALLMHDDLCDALLLGLGGGSLARALRAADDRLHVIGIEERAAVIDVARALFQLPRDRGFAAVCADARVFLGQTEAHFGAIFADLYLAGGVHPDQSTPEFLALCRDRLSDNGLLVVNQWASEYQRNMQTFAALRDGFADRLLNVHVQGGNIVSFAFRDHLPELRRDAFFDSAEALGQRLAIPLQRQARNLWRQNAEVLGVGRFRGRRRR